MMQFYTKDTFGEIGVALLVTFTFDPTVYENVILKILYLPRCSQNVALTYISMP
jgi:hypothetical protein